MEQYLVHAIHSSLSLGLHDNARFLAERLVAASPDEVGRTTSISMQQQQLLLLVVAVTVPALYGC